MNAQELKQNIEAKKQAIYSAGTAAGVWFIGFISCRALVGFFNGDKLFSLASGLALGMSILFIAFLFASLIKLIDAIADRDQKSETVQK